MTLKLLHRRDTDVANTDLKMSKTRNLKSKTLSGIQNQTGVLSVPECPGVFPVPLMARTMVLMVFLFVQVGNVVTIQAASVQEQLQRIQQLREQQQQKKRQAAEAKREQALSSTSQSDIIQKQVCVFVCVRACIMELLQQ